MIMRDQKGQEPSSSNSSQAEATSNATTKVQQDVLHKETEVDHWFYSRVLLAPINHKNTLLALLVGMTLAVIGSKIPISYEKKGWDLYATIALWLLIPSIMILCYLIMRMREARRRVSSITNTATGTFTHALEPVVEEPKAADTTQVSIDAMETSQSFMESHDNTLHPNSKVEYHILQWDGHAERSVKSQDGLSRLYTHIKPYARTWTDGNQRCVQLMANVKCGWNIDMETFGLIEPSQFQISVQPNTKNVLDETTGISDDNCCILQLDSIPSQQSLRMEDKVEQTRTLARQKGVSVELKAQVGVGTQGVTITTPGVIFGDSKSSQEELKKMGIIVEKLEFEQFYQTESNNSATWIMKRLCSRVIDSVLNRIDLNLYQPSAEFSKDQLKKIEFLGRGEPYSDFVNFGVWKWNGQSVTFEFHIRCVYRVFEEKTGLFHFHSHYQSREHVVDFQSVPFSFGPVKEDTRWIPSQDIPNSTS